MRLYLIIKLVSKMTNYRNSGNDQESSNHRLLRLLKRSSLALGAVFIAGGAIGAWWAKNYIDQDLAPLVEKNLQDLLGRPVKIGQVESFTLSGLRFASLAIPATATEADRVTAKGLDVQFSPLEVLFTRTLKFY
jgi:translocation and assembly module TamB